MSTYPIFLKSHSFRNIEESKPLLPKQPEQPQSPKLIKKNWLEKLILYCDEYEDKTINLKRIDRYLEKVIEYEAELKKYNERVKGILSETNIKIYHDERKRSVLSQTVFADLSTRETLKGRYEPFFHTYLKTKFGNNIFDNLEFQLPNSNAFVPDFSYIDKSSGLCIDIEIDEPYTSDSKIPIHCIGDDDYRNNYFLSKGWFVIRFAEIQVAKHPHLCCNFIQAIIEYLTVGKEFEPFSFPYNCWSYSAASDMAKNNIRNTY
jgi:hypothetical protein